MLCSHLYWVSQMLRTWRPLTSTSATLSWGVPSDPFGGLQSAGEWHMESQRTSGSHEQPRDTKELDHRK